MSLDLAVAQTVAHAALLEAALHSRQTWYIEVDGDRREAVREVHEHGVTFRACFTARRCSVEWMALYEGDVFRSLSMVDTADEGQEFCIAWEIALSEAVPA